MYYIFVTYPIIGTLALIICAVLTMLVSANLYMYVNRHLLTANKKNKSRIKEKCIKVINNKVNAFDDNHKSGLYNKCKLRVLKSGFYRRYAVFVYIALAYVAPVFLFINLVIFSDFSSALILSLSLFVGVQAIMFALKKEIESEWKNSGYVIYRYIHNQLSSGVSIRDTISSLYMVGIGTKLEKPLYDLSARYSHTLDIDYSLQEFRKYFSLSDINIFANTLEQGVKIGNINDLVSRQVRSMFKQYLNYIQAKTDRSKSYTTAIVLILGGIVCAMIMIPMIKDIGSSIKAIFSY